MYGHFHQATLKYGFFSHFAGSPGHGLNAGSGWAILLSEFLSN